MLDTKLTNECAHAQEQIMLDKLAEFVIAFYEKTENKKAFTANEEETNNVANQN